MEWRWRNFSIWKMESTHNLIMTGYFNKCSLVVSRPTMIVVTVFTLIVFDWLLARFMQSSSSELKSATFFQKKKQNPLNGHYNGKGEWRYGEEGKKDPRNVDKYKKTKVTESNKYSTASNQFVPDHNNAIRFGSDPTYTILLSILILTVSFTESRSSIFDFWKFASTTRNISIFWFETLFKM